MKNKTGLEVQIGERLFQFICDDDAPLGMIFDALHQLRSHVIKVLAAVEEKEKAQDPVEEKKE